MAITISGDSPNLTSATLATPTISSGALTLNSSGLAFSDSTTQTSGSGVAKAWVNFNGVTTATIRASYNVSSVTRNGTGDYSVNFTNALVDANYVPNISTSAIGSYSGTPTIFTIPNLTEVAPTNTGFRFSLPIWNNTAGAVDQKYVAVSVFR